MLDRTIIGAPYEGNVNSWIIPSIKRTTLEDANMIDTFLADFHRRTVAIIVNSKSASPDIKIRATGTTGLPSRSEADVITDSRYVPMPKIASVLFFISFYYLLNRNEQSYAILSSCLSLFVWDRHSGQLRLFHPRYCDSFSAQPGTPLICSHLIIMDMSGISPRISRRSHFPLSGLGKAQMDSTSSARRDLSILSFLPALPTGENGLISTSVYLPCGISDPISRVSFVIQSILGSTFSTSLTDKCVMAWKIYGGFSIVSPPIAHLGLKPMSSLQL